MNDHEDRKQPSKHLELLRIVHECCEKNQIPYSILGGTLIGAVRHKGFIPWDKDSDIGVPRSDYRKLILILKETLTEPYLVKSPELDSHYLFGFSKLYDVSTSLPEHLVSPVDHGVWLDIFPIDGTFRNPVLRYLHFVVTLFLKTMLATRSGAFKNKSDLKTLMRKLLRGLLFVTPISFWQMLLQKALTACPFEQARYAGNFVGRWRYREVNRKLVFTDRVLFEFESLKVYGLKRYDEYLTRIYGDYMTPPKGRVAAKPASH